MCGISAYIGDDAVKHVVSALRLLEIRGYDSTGIAVWNDGISVLKDTGYVSDVYSDGLPVGAMCIGHVRWATHGEVSQLNAHPQVDCENSIAVCHNGVIENAYSLIQSLRPHHVFRSETDTEIIAHLLEGGDILARLKVTCELLEGYNSFVVLSEGRVFAFCGGPPLLLSEGEIASDAFALVSRRFLSLRRGDIVELLDSGYVFHQGSPGSPIERMAQNSSILSSTPEAVTFFQQEIRSQPHAMLSALGNDGDHIAKIARGIGRGAILAGAGSSKVACMWAKSEFLRAGTWIEVVPLGEWHGQQMPEAELTIAVSQSGETGTLVPMIESINATSRRLAAVTNVPWSFLARHADDVLELHCGEERSVIASKSFMAECIVLGQIAAAIRHNTAEYTNMVRNASLVLADWLSELEKAIDALALDFNRCFVVGEGGYYAIAHEGAMKLKEGAYVFAEPIVASEFKHEALPLITSGELIIWVGETAGGGIAQVAEMRARGARVLGFAVKDIGFDIHVRLPPEAVVFPPLAVVPLQLLTSSIASRKGINIDRPRNLAKAVTVR